MNSDQYFHRGLRLIVASVLVFFLIVLFCVMVSRGFPFWMALVLLVPAGLCVAGLYYFSIGTSADLSELFFRRFRCEWPKSDEISIVEEKPEPAVEVTDEKRLDPAVAISEVIPGDPAPETPILENALSTVYTYTDQILGEALDESNRLILRRRLLYLACMEAGSFARALSLESGPPTTGFSPELKATADPAPPADAGALAGIPACWASRCFRLWISSAFLGMSLSGMRSR